jgi:hypothetical protein
MAEVVKVLTIAEFDPEGGPEIQVMADGSINVVFNFMPPSWATDPDQFNNFDEAFADAIGVELIWEDRELFMIENPEADTLDRIKHFLLSYPR